MYSTVVSLVTNLAGHRKVSQLLGKARHVSRWSCVVFLVQEMLVSWAWFALLWWWRVLGRRLHDRYWAVTRSMNELIKHSFVRLSTISWSRPWREAATTVTTRFTCDQGESLEIHSCRYQVLRFFGSLNTCVLKLFTIDWDKLDKLGVNTPEFVESKILALNNVWILEMSFQSVHLMVSHI